MKILLLYFILIIAPVKLLSQNCFVTVDSLKGQYDGDCKNGKANGTGIAKGTDLYTGNFKNGYPNGVGKYTWANGNIYDGHWKDGLFDGEGTLITVNKNEKDSSVVIKGFWKKGKFINKSENLSPFKVTALTSSINDFSMKKLNGTDGQITIIVKSTTGGAATINSETSTVAVPVLSNVQLVQGIYNQEVADERPSSVFNKYILRQITFPFEAILSFQLPNTSISSKKNVQQLNVEIPQVGNYYLEVNLDE